MKLKYTKEFLKDLAKENNVGTRVLAELLGVSWGCFYNYCYNKLSDTKWGKTAALKFEKKVDSFIKKSESIGKPKNDIGSGKYIIVYLDYMELCYQLSQGIEVYQDNSNDSLKMVDGLIVRFRNGKAVFVNCAISLDEKYYMKVPKPIKVEVGKRYLTEKGEEAIVVAESEYYTGSYLVCIIGKQGNVFVEEDGTSVDSVKYDIRLVEKIDD